MIADWNGINNKKWSIMKTNEKRYEKYYAFFAKLALFNKKYLFIDRN
jgi:hypothetical protein